MLDLMAAAREACEKAAIADVSLAAPREVMAACLEIGRARASLEATELHLLARLEAEGITDRETGHKTAQWVASQTGAAVSSINARVKRARQLRLVSEVDAAFAAGLITADHVGQFTWAASLDRIAAHLEDLVAEFLPTAIAHREPFRRWRDAFGRRVDELDQDGPFDPDRELARNSLSATVDEPGVVRFAGQMVGEHAEGFWQAIQTETDRLYRRYATDHDLTGDVAIPDRGTLHALALIELVRAGRYGRPSSNGPTVEVTLVATVEDPDQLITPDGTYLPIDTTRHLRCDATFTPLIVDHQGVPLAMGRRHRHATRDQRRALTHRDGGCVFPGCNARASWCDAHHITPWHHGGPTDLANLALLCRHHHGVTHRQGWTMVAHPDQTFTWTTPTGDLLHSQRHHHQRTPTG